MTDPIVRYVKLTRDDKLGYGLTIVTTVYTHFIKAIIQQSPAEGRVFVNEDIISINGESMKYVSHEEMVKIFITNKSVTLGLSNSNSNENHHPMKL
jgi:C-terminal processing protease CtpA/Prc